MKWLKFAASLGAIFALASASQAATLPVANGDFEDAFTLSTNMGYGPWSFGAASWGASGAAGTFAPDPSAGNYSGFPAEIGSRVGWVNNGASFFQDLGVTVAANTDYTVSALFLHRLDLSFAGSFGFFAGDASNIIGTQTLVDPGSRNWSLQSFTLDAAVAASFVGQSLGIIFLGSGVQFNFDNVTVFAGLLEDEKVLVNPVPGAVWLFGSALAAGFAARRRKKAA